MKMPILVITYVKKSPLLRQYGTGVWIDRCSAVLVIRQMKIKMNYISHKQDWQKFKRSAFPNTGEDVKK